MGFWVFMLLMVLLIPVIMITVGRAFLRAAPKQINPVFGYRTSMSMKNQDTWEFAHRYSGRLWLRCGLFLLPVSLAAMLLTLALGGSDGTVGVVGSVVELVQLAVIISSIFPTERALKRTFDRNGKRLIPTAGDPGKAGDNR